MELFENSIKLIDADNGKEHHVNVSENTEKLYNNLLASIQNKDEHITQNLNTFLLNFYKDIDRNAYIQGSMNGPIFPIFKGFNY